MLRYNRMYWVEIDGMQKQWERARVNAQIDGRRIAVTTSNVSALHLDWVAGLAPAGPDTRLKLDIDGTSLELPAVRTDLVLERRAGEDGPKWRIGGAADGSQQGARPAGAD